MIAAKEAADDLKLPCSQIAGVFLYEYQLSVKLTSVPSSASRP